MYSLLNTELIFCSCWHSKFFATRSHFIVMVPWLCFGFCCLNRCNKLFWEQQRNGLLRICIWYSSIPSFAPLQQLCPLMLSFMPGSIRLPFPVPSAVFHGCRYQLCRRHYTLSVVQSCFCTDMLADTCPLDSKMSIKKGNCWAVTDALFLVRHQSGSVSSLQPSSSMKLVRFLFKALISFLSLAEIGQQLWKL